VAFLYGAHDQIIPRASAVKAAERLPASARTAIYAQGYHMLLRDLHADIVYGDILSYLHDPDAPFPSGAPPLRAPPHPPAHGAQAGAQTGAQASAAQANR